MMPLQNIIIFSSTHDTRVELASGYNLYCSADQGVSLGSPCILEELCYSLLGMSKHNTSSHVTFIISDGAFVCTEGNQVVSASLSIDGFQLRYTSYICLCFGTYSL